MTDDHEIRDRFWRELAESPFLMVGLVGSRAHSLPMTAQLDRHADHAIWFYTTRDCRLAAGGPAMAQFASKDHYLFACTDGHLVEERDPAVIRRYWSSEVADWYKGGMDDPNLLMLRFDLGKAEIWRADVSISGMFRMLFGGHARDELRHKHAEVDL